MKIGIIGAGNMGSALAKIWADSGHPVMLSYSRDRAKLDSTAAKIGKNVTTGTPAEAAEFGDIVLLVVPWSAVKDALDAAGSMSSKTVISCVNSLKADFSGLEVGTTTSAAEEIAKLMPDTKVVEVLFPFAEILHSDSRKFGTETPTQFYCGDDPAAKAIAAELIAEVGLQPVDAGGLTNARYLEPAAMMLVQMAYGNGMGTNLGLKLLQR